MDNYISGHEGSNEGAHLGRKAKMVPTLKLGTVKPLFKGAVNRPLNRGNPLNGGNLCTSM